MQQDSLTLDNNRKDQLDSNIKKMLESGASNDDVMSYAGDFKNKFGVKKKDITQPDFQFGSQTSPFGSKPSQTQVDTKVPSVLTPEYREEYKAQVATDTQKKKDLSKQLQGAKDVYYQAQGDATLFSSYNGYQSDLIKIDNELTKNYPDEATVSRTVSGQEDSEKYKAKRDQLIADRNKLNELSKETLKYINPKIQSKIDSDLKKNGLDKFTRNVYSGTKAFPVADELEIDGYAKQIAEESGLPDDGTFKKLVYDTVKATVSREIVAPEINKRFINQYVKETGLTPDQAIQKDQINNFLDGKKIQLELSISVDSLNKEIKTKVDDGVNTMLQQYKPMFESINADYKTKIAEAEAGINQLNESYKAGGMPRPRYELEFNNIKSQLDLVNQQYKQQSDNLSKEYLNGQNELLSQFNKRYKRQVSEFQSMAEQKLSAASIKYGKEYTPSSELKSQFDSIYGKAAKTYFDEDESIKYQLDKSSLLNLVGGQAAKNLFIGFGGSLKSLSAMYDFDAGYVLGDYLENSFVSSSPEIKSAWDFIDLIKLQSSTGRMLGGMAPILASSALTAAVTKNAPTAIRLLTTGLANYLVETAQIGGGVKDQVFQKTGNIADANKASKKVMDANLYLLPLYAVSGLPFLGNVTLGIKNTFARAGAKALIETAEEIPQEYFQGIFEDLAVADRPISQTFEEMSLERFENTALNVIPTSVLLGGGGTAIKGVRESISKFQGRSLAAKVDLADLTETTKKQFIYDTVLRRGDVFSKAYVSSLFNSGNINEQEMESFSKMIDDSANIMAESKKIGLNKADSKIYAALRFDYLQSKNEFDSEQDEVSKKVYKAKMDSAEKSLNTYLSGGKPDAVVLTLANNEQYIYSFETLNSIINEGGEILNQIVNGEVSIGLLSDKTNPKAKALSDKLTQLKTDAVQNQISQLTPETVQTMVEETESKIKNKSLFRDGGYFANELGGSGIDSVPTNRSKINGIEFVQFSNPNTGVVDVVMTGTSGSDFVGFYRIYENGKPTNKWSSKFENQSRNKKNFKTMISGVQSMLPKGHEYTEKTSISTDGLRVWNQQLGRGYELQYDNEGNLITNRVAINGDAITNDLGVDVNQGNFDNISVTNKTQFESVKKALIPYLQKFGLNESNIHWENGTVTIDLPVLKNKESNIEPNIAQPTQEEPIIEPKTKTDAVQKQTAGQVPVLTEATAGQEVEQGKPEAKPEVVTEEGKEVVSTTVLDKIPRGNTFQERLAPDYYEKLKKDIKENGIKEPIILTYYPKDNALRLSDGHHRLAIAKELGITDIPTKVNVAWSKSIKDNNPDIEGQPIYNAPKTLDIESYRKRDYFPSNVRLDEIGLATKAKGVTEEGVQEEVAPVIESIANLKLDENNLESVIEELEFIEDAKRKAARSSTSSKTKAKLNADIAQYEANIADKPNEVRIAKTINDNFDKIKKDLKEQGLLNVKC